MISDPSGFWSSGSVTYMACSSYTPTPAPKPGLFCRGEIPRRWMMEKHLTSLTCTHLRCSLSINGYHCAAFCIWRWMGKKSNPDAIIKCIVCIPSSEFLHLKKKFYSSSTLHFDNLSLVSPWQMKTKLGYISMKGGKNMTKIWHLSSQNYSVVIDLQMAILKKLVATIKSTLKS